MRQILPHALNDVLAAIFSRFPKFLQRQLVNHRFEVAIFPVAVEIGTGFWVCITPFGDFLFVFRLGECPLGDNVFCDHLNVFTKLALQKPIILAKTAVGDMGLVLAFGAICSCLGTARKRRPGKAADDGRAPALAIHLELVGVPDAEEGCQLEIDCDECACKAEPLCCTQGAYVESAAPNSIMRVNVGVARGRKDFVLVAQNQVQIVVKQLLFALKPFFLEFAQFLLFAVFLFHFVANQLQAGSLSLAHRCETFALVVRFLQERREGFCIVNMDSHNVSPCCWVGSVYISLCYA